MIRVILPGAPCAEKSSLRSALADAVLARRLQDRATLSDAQAMPQLPGDFQLHLLTGLTATQLKMQDADQAIRDALAAANTPYDVLYGTLTEQVSQAMDLITTRLDGQPGMAANTAASRQPPGKKPPAWVWACDKCSDPECEHRLLTGLLESRHAAAT